MKPSAAPADRYAAEVVRELMAMRWSRARAINAVQGDERYVRQQFSRGTPPAFAAGVLARKVRRTRGQEIVGLARGTAAASRAGLASGGGQCIPYTPPLFVDLETGAELEKHTALAFTKGSASSSKGMAWGSRATRGGSRDVLAGITVTAKSWNKAGALYVSSSANGKIGAVDTTWVSVSSTCVDCDFLTNKVCYTMGYPSSQHVERLDAAAERARADSTQCSLDEAACIDAAYNGGQVPSGRILRLHSSGDTSTPEGAVAVAKAVDGWLKRGGQLAYTYTHAWRRVPRHLFGKLSVLASLNPGDDAREALRQGYGSVTALVPLEEWAARMVLSTKGSFTFKKIKVPDTQTELDFIPCPAQYPVDTTTNFESLRWKLGLLASRLGVPAEEVDDFIAKAQKGVKFTPLVFLNGGLADFSRSRLIMSMREQIANTVFIPAVKNKDGVEVKPAVYFGDPLSREFQVLFRKVSSQEKPTCDKCTLCHDDQKLGRSGRAIAFRGDKGGENKSTIIPMESLIQRARVQQKIAEASE